MYGHMHNIGKYGRWGVLTVLIAPPPQAMLLVAYYTSSSWNKGHVVLNVLGTRQASADSFLDVVFGICRGLPSGDI